MKAKEFILLIIIIAAGIFFYHAQTGKIHIDFDWGDGIFFDYDEFSYEEYQEIEPPFPPELQIKNAHGDVEIQGTEEDKITIVFKKKIRRRNEEKAKKVADDLHIVSDKDAQRLMITTNRDDFRRRNFETCFNISIPSGMEIDVKNSYGLVKVSKVGKTNIVNRHGEVFAQDIGGELTIENSYEDVEVKNVQSDCQIDSRDSDIVVNNVEGNAKFFDKYGRIHVENVSKGVTIEAKDTRVFCQDIEGQVDVTTSYDKITLNNVGRVIIKGSHSPVEIDGAREYVEITNKYSKVKLNDIRGNLKIDGKDMGVDGQSIVGDRIFISTTYDNIELAEFSGKTDIILSNGKIQLSPSLLTHPIKVEGEYTDIVFFWPKEGKYPVEASNKGGGIKWNLPYELSLFEENSKTTIKAFVEEKGRPSISLSTTYGTIRIEEALNK